MAVKQEFYFDLVVCIDKTFKMSNQMDFLLDFINGFYDMAKAEIQSSGLKLKQLRVRVISYTDYNKQDNAVEDSGFFVLPEQSSELYTVLEQIEPQVICKNQGFSSGLEALSVAIKGDYVDLSDKNGRQAIVVFSKNKPLSLQQSRLLENYPSDMPSSLEELRNRWDTCSLDLNKKMLTLFCDMQKGENSWYPLSRWNKTMVIDTEDITEYTKDFILETILIDII